MSRIYYLLTISFLMIGCVSQSDYDKVKEENKNLKNSVEQLETKLSNIEYDYNKLIEEKRLAEIERNKKKYRTEVEALSTLKDYYEFYNANEVYRRPKVRRVDNNTFRISLEECPKVFKHIEFHWNSSVKTLVINNDGTYNVN